MLILKKKKKLLRFFLKKKKKAFEKAGQEVELHPISVSPEASSSLLEIFFRKRPTKLQIQNWVLK